MSTTDWRETLSFLDNDTQTLGELIPDYDLTVRLLLAILAQANMSDAPEYKQPWQLHNDAGSVYGAIQDVLGLLGADAARDEASENGEVSTKPGELEARFCPRRTD